MEVYSIISGSNCRRKYNPIRIITKRENTKTIRFQIVRIPPAEKYLLLLEGFPIILSNTLKNKYLRIIPRYPTMRTIKGLLRSYKLPSIKQI